ncbi:sarcosine oxidase subunit gamma [Aureimonas flava]|uniref:sarcosine oxidase subunit gamma n=1 Tax=Aureimonas flava TaxID=2320271 RepID=UPI001FDF4E53|nr:sarcosine oxidase subunit gamma family protein [Aureimonas flava]
MTDFALSERPAFFGAVLPTSAALAASERTGLGIATVTARRGRAGELAETVRAAFGVSLPSGPKAVRSGGLTFVGTGPGTWLAFQDGGGWRFARDLAERLGPLASVCDQSSGYGVLRVAGPKTRATLAKGVPVDLHPAAFRPGDAAVTLASHVGIVLWQVDEEPTYDIAVFRSLAGSFADWLAASAAEFTAVPGH